MKKLAALALILICSQACAEPRQVLVAQSLIGQGETVGDNRGAFIKKIGGIQGQAWCAYFASYCLRLPRPIPNARGFLKAFPRVSRPAAGDLVVWSRGKDGRCGHVGIIKSVSEGHFEALEGNTGAFPSRVRVIRHKLSEKSILGFVRP